MNKYEVMMETLTRSGFAYQEAGKLLDLLRIPELLEEVGRARVEGSQAYFWKERAANAEERAERAEARLAEAERVLRDSCMCGEFGYIAGRKCPSCTYFDREEADGGE